MTHKAPNWTPSKSIEQTASDYAAMMQSDPKAEQLYQDISTEEYGYPHGEPSRNEAQATMSRTDQVQRAILREADTIITGDRNTYYGPPEVNHSRTAALWSTYLGIVVTPRQVCLMNVLQKISRDVNIEKHDNLVDGIGYLANAAACAAAVLPVNGT